MDVIIVCHTEFGIANGKKTYFYKDKIEGVSQGTKNLVKVARKYGANITFVVMPESVKYFPKELKKDFEIGLHLHPGWRYFGKPFNWYAGDSILRKKFKSKKNSTILQDYSYEEQFEIIKIGKEYIKKVLKITPKVFVAGRWSENNDTIKALIKLGFTHDCTANSSIKARHFDWSKLPRICMPYHPSKHNYQKKGNLPLFMIPISQFWPKGGVTVEAVPRYGLGWLRACFKEYYKQGAPLFHIFVHSPAMTSSYFIKVFDEFLRFILKHKNIKFKFTSEIKEYKIKKRFKTNIWPYLLAAPKLIKNKLKC